MTTSNQPLARAKGNSTLVRAKFGPGMLLQSDDLEQLNNYTRELNRLMFRSLFGCGVVCGLVVATEVKCGKVNVTVGCGLALDCQGDPVYVPKSLSIVLDEECDPNIRSPLWVVLCGTEKCCAPRTSMCASDEDDSPSVCTRERDGFEIRIVAQPPKCLCGCPEAEGEATADSPGANDAGVPVSVTTNGGVYSTGPAHREADCRCADPTLACYRDHYEGKCCCSCSDCSGCDCDCILLARLDKDDTSEEPKWKADHCVRRFIRPVLMRDPECKQAERTAPEPESDVTLAVSTPPSVKKRPTRTGRSAPPKLP